MLNAMGLGLVQGTAGELAKLLPIPAALQRFLKYLAMGLFVSGAAWIPVFCMDRWDGVGGSSS